MAIKWSRRSYTEDEFRQVWLSSNSIRECAIKLGIGPTSPTTHSTARQLGLTTQHMTGMVVSNLPKNKRELEKILVYGKLENSHALKLRLIKEKVLLAKCSSCNLTTWLDAPIPLELDHTDGDRLNNTLENLRLLCPNCHAKTDTYRGKNASKEYKRLLEKNKNKCKVCGVIIKKSSVHCKKHGRLTRGLVA